VEYDSEERRTAEVVEQLEEEQIDLEVVRWVAGERAPSSAQRRWLEQLHRERGERFYGDLMFVLTGHRYTPVRANRMWGEIIAHCEFLTRSLGRNPGIVVAALDYLTNAQGHEAPEFSLIETGKLNKMLERAVADGLTELYDHDTLLTLLDKEIQRANRYAERVALLLLDLDDFKQVNDDFGHQKGDEVLAQVATVVRQTIRTMDIAGRYGGEEFAIIIPEADRAAAVHSAERLRMAVEDRFQHNVKVTVSVGVASFPVDARTGGDLVKMADKALYAAKARGKNRVVASHEA
jgi:diguanylate cyclase (GGDEF)-like protein